MRVSLTARDLVLVTWAVSPATARRDLPAGVELAHAESGEALVSLVAFRAAEVRAGSRRTPGWTQLAVRTYVRHAGEDGVFFFLQRVTLPGLGGVLFGTPVRPARIRVSDGRAVAGGLGVALRYRRTGGAADVPLAGGVPIGAQQVAFYVSAGLRRLPSPHAPPTWEPAELVDPPRTDPVLALGFDAGDPISVLAAASTRFSFDLPGAKVG
jgi:hypothetical protein